MDSIVAIPQKIVDWLSEQEELGDITFFTEFPPIIKASPLKRAIVAVGFEEVKITDKFVANDDGVLERQEYCRTADIKARLSICVPYSYGGSACHDTFTKVIDALTFRTDLNITESGCEATESDRDTSALVLNGWFRITADFCPAENLEDNYYSFIQKEMLCGSHVTNEAIHVTAEDKEYWNNPLQIGFYSGTGASTRTISIGYKPKLVIVFCTENPFMTLDFSQSTANSQLGVAVENYGTLGISLSSQGFKLSTSTLGAVTSSFNTVGYSYCYIAVK